MSQWYAAHILMYVKRKRRTAGPIPGGENVVLIKADSEEEALAKAEQRGKQGEGDDDGTFRWDGQHAEWVFAGVRKLTLCEDPDKRPGDGTELTYTQMEVRSMQGIADLLAGKPSLVEVLDLMPESQRELASQPA